MYHLKWNQAQELLIFLIHQRSATEKSMNQSFKVIKYSEWLTISDLRGDNVSQLTAEEKAAIQKQFKEIDADGSGYITKEEAIRYVTKKLNKMLQSREESISKLIAANPDKKTELEAQLESTRNIAREGMKIELQYLFEKDTNADGKVFLPFKRINAIVDII